MNATQKQQILNDISILLLNYNEEYKCPEPDYCREGDPCHWCDISNRYTHGIQKLYELVTSLEPSQT